MSRLKPCSSKPNCVSSRAPESDKQHYIAPLSVGGEVSGSLERLKRVVLALPRTTLKEESEGYFRVVFTTALLRFRDDVEFELDASAGVIHVRSASRVGHSDMGLNRKRVEQLRSLMG